MPLTGACENKQKQKNQGPESPGKWGSQSKTFSPMHWGDIDGPEESFRDTLVPGWVGMAWES